jgi:hypothetical protein
MAIDIACPSCRQKYHLKDELAGKKAKCVKCGASIAIPAPVAAVAAKPLPDLSDLFSDFHAEPAKPLAPVQTAAAPKSAKSTSSPAAKSGCPGCGAALEKSAVICVKCGYNARTGKKLETRHEDIDASAGRPAKATKVTLLKGTALSAIGAALGAGVWVAIAIFTGYEVGYVAWGLGAAAGIGMAIAHDDDDGTFAGIIAAGMSIGGIFAAKFFIFQHFQSMFGDFTIADVPDAEGLEGVDQQQLAEFGQLLQENITFASMFSPIDALFILLAVGSAYKLGSGKAVD